MTRYYKPHTKELEGDLLVEIYSTDSQYPEKAHWKPISLNNLSRSALIKAHKEDNIRVKYLDSFDFNELGYTVEKTFLGTQTYVVDIIEHFDKENEEITEEKDVFDEEVLIILKKGIPQGKFMPWLPKKNVEFKGKDHSIKNLTELRKILK